MKGGMFIIIYITIADRPSFIYAYILNSNSSFIEIEKSYIGFTLIRLMS